MRIIHILRAPMGGVLRHVSDLAQAQTRAGHQVGILCDAPGTAGYNEPLLAVLETSLALGITRVAMTRSVGPGDISVTLKIRNILNDLSPDVVHGHGAKGGVYARTAGSLSRGASGKPARFYSPHGGSLHYDPASASGRIYFTVERLLERATDMILFVADYERDTYAAKIGEPACASCVTYNGLAPSEFEPVVPVDDAADFLFIGEMRLLKGPDMFVQALGRMAAAGKAPSAVMVGEGPDRAAIEAMATETRGARIRFRPPMPARQAFALARTVVMPSRAEAMPYIVLEALAAGCGLIATNVGGIPEIFGDRSACLVAPEPDAVHAAMANALAQPDALKAAMPDAATLRARFSIDTMAHSILGAYETVLEKRAR